MPKARKRFKENKLLSRPVHGTGLDNVTTNFIETAPIKDQEERREGAREETCRGDKRYTLLDSLFLFFLSLLSSLLLFLRDGGIALESKTVIFFYTFIIIHNNV